MSLTVVHNPTREAWNEFVASQPGANLYQSYEWGDIRRMQGWTPRYVALTDGRAWVVASLILVKRLPGGLGALLYSPRGPITSPCAPCALPALVEVVRSIAEEVCGIFWRVEPPIVAQDEAAGVRLGQAGFRRVHQEWSYWNRPKYEMRLDLNDGEAAVFSRLGTKIRTKVRHALKRGVAIEEGCGEQDVEHFYRLMRDTSMKKRIPVRGLDYFRSLYHTLVKADMGRLFIARKDRVPVAAGLTSKFGKTASLLYLSNDYSMQRAGWAVQWEMIRWAIAQGCTLYDFGGTGTNYPPKETDKGYGVYQFKKSFGAEIVAWYGYADYVFRPVRYGWFRAIERSLPYGERFFLDWPNRLSYRWRAGNAQGRGQAASHDAKERLSGG